MQLRPFGKRVPRFAFDPLAWAPVVHAPIKAGVVLAENKKKRKSNMKKKTNEKKAPTHGVYVVQGDDDKARWLKIGAAWLHGDGKGANIILEALPLSNKIVVREITEKDTSDEGAQQ